MRRFCINYWFLRFEEVELLRGGPARDLLSPMRRRHYLAKAAVVDVVVVTPPCNTHSRARHSGMPGPPPLRDAPFPRGLPELSAANQRSVDEANMIADLSVEVLRVAADNGRFALLEFPED